MRRYGTAVLLLLTGGAVLRITLFSELYLRYVQAGLRPYLIVSGAALVLLGLATAVLRSRTPDDHVALACEDQHGHDEQEAPHSHHRTPRTAWLLTLPAVALLLFPPPALGSYSAAREAAQRAAQGVGTFPALPAGNPVELTVAEFSSRAIYDSRRSLKGRTVRLTGFVTHGDDGTWYVTRLTVSCCAADATTSKAEVRGADALPADTWVTVTGTWHPKGALGSDEAWPPVLDVTTVTQVKQPADPYEKP
ncbi:TIGR03943 family putative permease subunit [Streptomyces aurantiogriseus]|uniref:TIGR03943 family protein n=1 Tax=Streptomyces aurantiogriseus TaxID=66870 RepID=A0A918BTP3_9ACTN|nr:TIGR03943 family protein [Streptomyces aurantiogriseus]GGQ91924.1 TIGR03943 family protein [Streptomyces aurantiogriseus]